MKKQIPQYLGHTQCSLAVSHVQLPHSQPCSPLLQQAMRSRSEDSPLEDPQSLFFTFTLLFSHLADAFIQSDLQIRKSN